MHAEYKRDMNHNYLILCGDSKVDTSSYQVRMLAGNVIPSLLKCRIQGIDGELLFYYEITSRQSVTALYEKKKLHIEDLQLIFGSFVRVMEEMSEYLLNPGQLVLYPEYMYVDVEKRELYFCYLPGFEQEVKIQFQTLTEYVLPKLDHEDSRAVMLGYGIYRRALEDSFHLEHIKEELYHTEGKEADNPFSGERMQKESSVQELENGKVQEDIGRAEDEASENFFSRDKGGDLWAVREETDKVQKVKKNSIGYGIRGMLAGCAAGTAAILMILGGNLAGIFPQLQIEIMLGILLIFLGIGVLGAFFIEKHAKKQKDKDFEEKLPELIREKADTGSKVKEVKEMAEQIVPSIPFAEESCGETVVLSANTVSGPASLVSREPGELATIYLTEELTVIGKLYNAADAVIPIPTVSRVHARIRKRDGEYYLTDLNSRNGTSVNGRMLKGDEEYQLQEEDEVDFAQARYIFLK